MEWNPVLEHRLKTKSQKAGWRWIAYTLLVIGLAVFPLGSIVIEKVSTEEGWISEDPAGVLKVLGVLAGLFLLLALVLALPAEKAAKEAKELMAQKKAAEAATVPSSATGRACTACKATVGAARFCPECGMPQPSV